MPSVTIALGGNEAIYKLFSQRHPKYPLFRKKTIGVALLPINNSADGYLESVNGKNSAAYYSRKAERKGYTFSKIDPNDYVDDIYAINTSKPERQGRSMAQQYVAKVDHYEMQENWRYFGVLSAEGKLVSYAWVPCHGQVWLLGTLLGHGDYLNDGVMYLLVTKVVLEMYSEIYTSKNMYLMYDMFLGAQKGLRDFKLKCGFLPYRVRWLR
jgi:hypothetical protein